MAPVLIAGADLATNRGDLRRAASLLEELRVLGPVLEDDREKHRVALHLAEASAGLGDRMAAVARLSEAEHLLPDDRMAALERVNVRSAVDLLTRDFRSAVLHSEMAIEMSREMGLTHEAMLNLHNLGVALVQLDDAPRAYQAFRESLGLCEEYGYERLANYNRMFLAYLDGMKGTADADKLLGQGMAYAESREFVWEIVAGGALLARLLHRRGQIDAARSEYERARVAATRAGHKLVADECEMALVRLAGAHGALSSARRESAS